MLVNKNKITHVAMYKTSLQKWRYNSVYKVNRSLKFLKTGKNKSFKNFIPKAFFRFPPKNGWQKKFVEPKKIKKQTSLISTKPYHYNFLKIFHQQLLMPFKKKGINYLDKIIRFYKLHYNTTMYTYKAFLVMELQINTLLARTKLIPFLFLAQDLCYYNLVKVNNNIKKNPYTLVTLYNTLSIPVAFYNLMYCRQYLLQQAPWLLLKFLKVFWLNLHTAIQNKIWLLSNFISSSVLASSLIFAYPNIYLYKAPLRQLTRLHYKNQTYPYLLLKYRKKAMLRLHRAISLRLFDYSTFFNFVVSQCQKCIGL